MTSNSSLAKKLQGFMLTDRLRGLIRMRAAEEDINKSDVVARALDEYFGK